MAIISIDGACKNNGKPNCIAAGAAFVKTHKKGAFTSSTGFDLSSTNQRGELTGLIKGLDAANILTKMGGYNLIMITDSEYISNSINKEWYKNWERKGWLTANNEPVKNQDLWMTAAKLLEKCTDLQVYHIKGHVIPFGKVTAQRILAVDPSGETLYKEVMKKYDQERTARDEAIYKAKELFARNNGFFPQEHVFKEMVVCNIVTDLIATEYLGSIT